MQVILLAHVPKVGKKHEIKNVSDGYALNFLFPRKLAEKATASKLAQAKEQEQQAKDRAELELNLFEKNLAGLKILVVHLRARANEKGSLYEGIHASEVVAALKAEHRIELPDGALTLEHPLKEIGEHALEISAYGRKGSLKVMIESLA